jgi:hypothetical protein
MVKKAFFTEIKTRRKLTPLIVVLSVTIIGTALLLGSHAATPYGSVTVNNGTLASGAASCPVLGAATASSVVFTSPVAKDGNVDLSLSCPGTPFSSTSFWNTQIPSNVALNANSAVYDNEIENQLCYGTFGTTAPNTTTTPCTKSDVSTLNTSDWSGPLYVVPANQPLVPVATYCGVDNAVTDDNMGDGNWTSTGWTTNSTSATHTAGNTDAVYTTPYLGSGQYQLTYTFSGSPASGSTMAVTLGATTVGNYTFSSAQDNFTDTKTITLPSGGYSALKFTPSTTFNGTISGISLLPYKAGLTNAVAGGVPIPADAHGAGEAAGGMNIPPSPTITSNGAKGSATYWYSIAAVNASGSASEISLYGTTINANATLSATNYNVLSWTPTAAATKYNIYRTYSSSVSSSSGLIGTVTTNGSVAPQTFDDTGITATAAVPYGDTDKEITIYQPSTDKEWEFWQFQKYNASGDWSACWGGVIDNVSTSNGIFPSNTGATATSLPLLGGVPRINELLAGQVDHVMNLSLEDNFYATTTGTAPNTVTTYPANVTDPGNKAYSWPATRNDGGSSSTLAIPEGQRFILNPSLNLTQYNATLVASGKSALTPYAMVIAVAAQKYGFVVDDSAGSVNTRIADPTTYTVAGLPNPYTTGLGVGGVNNGNKGLFGGSGSVMANFPWQDLEALPFNYGEPSS